MSEPAPPPNLGNLDGRPARAATRLFRQQESPLDVAFVAVVILAMVSVTMALQARARRRVASLKLSGGRRSLVMNLFGPR